MSDHPLPPPGVEAEGEEGGEAARTGEAKKGADNSLDKGGGRKMLR